MFVPIQKLMQQQGRGARSNPTGRFEPLSYHDTQETGQEIEEEAADAPKIQTTLFVDHAKSVLTHNDSPDLCFQQSLNPYRGCEHGCIYCFARPTHSYLGLSPGMDFETKLWYKPNAPDLLRKELERASYQCRPVALGSNTDPYQPIERTLRLTRSLLEILDEYRHPVAVVTKAALVTRDIDVLQRLAQQRLTVVCVSLTTLDKELARAMEPRAATPAVRLQTIKTLTQAGIPVTVLTSPLIPGLTDHETEHLLEAARDAGALHAAYTLVRLPYELKDLFTEWLHTHRPQRAAHVLSLLRQCHSGSLYQPQFGTRMRGEGVYAALLQQRFDKAYKRLGFIRGRELDCQQFRRSSAKQMGLWERETEE